MLAVCIRVFTKEGESFEFLNVASFFCRHKSQYFLRAIFVALQSFPQEEATHMHKVRIL